MRNLLLIWALLAAACAHAASPVLPSAVSIPSRTSGVAPLCVFFDASATTDAETTYPFGDLSYRAIFGDTGAGSWTYGANSNMPRNAGYGAVAAHCYETAGTYTWRMFASDGSATVSRSGSITVDLADTVFATNTICIANGTLPSPGAGGCPGGATVRQGTGDFDADMAVAFGANGCGTNIVCKRILFKKGDTFAASAVTNMTVDGPGIIGAYGSGADPIITISANSVVVLAFSQDVTATFGDWRIMNLEIDGQSRTNGIGIQAFGTAQQLAMIRLNIHHIHNGINFTDDGLNARTHTAIWDQVFVFENIINNIIGGGGGIGLYMSAARLGVLGGTFYETSAAEFPIRLPYVGKGVVQNTTIDTPASDKSCLTLRSTTTLQTNTYAAGEKTGYAIVADNKMTSASANNLSVGSADPNGTAEDAHNIIVERNWLLNGATLQTSYGITYDFSDAWIRNNLIVFSNAGVPETSGIQIKKDAAALTLTPDRVRIDNNTVYGSINKPFYGVIRFSAPAHTLTNMSAKNNLGYSLTASGTHVFFQDDYGNQTLSQPGSSNSTDAQITGTDPLFDGPLTTPKGFRIGTSSYAASGGIASYPSSNDDYYHCDDISANEHRGAFVPRARARCTGAAGP